MKVDKGYLGNPGSDAEPAELVQVQTVVNGAREVLEGRFAYLSEFEQSRAEAAGNAFALKNEMGNDRTLVGCCQRSFVLAAALRRADDPDVALFLGEKVASAGQIVMARLPRREAVRLYDGWWAWMEKEFPESRTGGGPTEEEQEAAAEQAKGESRPVRI